METPAYETEITRTVWDNKHGEKVIVKPDGDSLGLVEIISNGNFILLQPAVARLVAAALMATAEEVEAA